MMARGLSAERGREVRSNGPARQGASRRVEGRGRAVAESEHTDPRVPGVRFDRLDGAVTHVGARAACRVGERHRPRRIGEDHDARADDALLRGNTDGPQHREHERRGREDARHEDRDSAPLATSHLDDEQHEAHHPEDKGDHHQPRGEIGAPGEPCARHVTAPGPARALAFA